MHAVVVHVTIEDLDRARANLEEDVVPRVSQAPGFVSGSWIRLAADRGMSVIVFDSEEAAGAARERIQDQPTLGARLESVEVHEVVARA